MAKIGLVTFRGASRTKYDFEKSFQGAAAVYVITRRGKKTMGGNYHEPVYVGETNDLSTLGNVLDAHPKAACLKSNYANCICVHSDDDAKSRRKKRDDLIRKLGPACTD